MLNCDYLQAFNCLVTNRDFSGRFATPEELRSCDIVANKPKIVSWSLILFMTLRFSFLRWRVAVICRNLNTQWFKDASKMIKEEDLALDLLPKVTSECACTWKKLTMALHILWTPMLSKLHLSLLIKPRRILNGKSQYAQTGTHSRKTILGNWLTNQLNLPTLSSSSGYSRSRATEWRKADCGVQLATKIWGGHETTKRIWRCKWKGQQTSKIT